MTTMTTPTLTIRPAGAFSLRESALFGFGHRTELRYDGVMRMAFCVDGPGPDGERYGGRTGVEVRQDEAGVHVTVHAAPGGVDPDVVTAQVGRILSIDHDGRGFAEIGRRDPMIGRLQAAAPGLRPPQFHSPYEAAAWAVLSARRPARQMAALRQQLSVAHGTAFELAGETWHAFPTPRQLLSVQEFPGLPELKLTRLQEVARAALDGRLDAARLTALDQETAMAEVRELPGIGPFYSALVVVRACGLTDALALEPKAMAAAGRLYGLGHPATEDEYRQLAEPWRPFRTWATVLLRAAERRLP